MPGLALHIGMEMHCPHGGLVTIVPAGPPSVFVGSPSAPLVTTGNQMTVAGCAATPPCLTVTWLNISPNVLIHNQPLLTQAPPPLPPPVPGGGSCVGSATPVPPLVVAMQLSVAAR
ncbi:hypothetical protein GCM10009839_07730 [Catenulispora yoronensis]|uniref:Uncharacterized protein n=1 Tax=Catenulispora yoronensis TaxID=450799 RepID=A0ABN2TP38_9ACTN